MNKYKSFHFSLLMLVSLMPVLLTFGALCLLWPNQVTESEILFLFFSVVGIMRLELKNIPRIDNISSLSELLMLISKAEVQQWTRNTNCPKVAQRVLCPVNTLHFQKSCSGVDVFQTWSLLEKQSVSGFLKNSSVLWFVGFGVFF